MWPIWSLSQVWTLERATSIISLIFFFRFLQVTHSGISKTGRDRFRQGYRLAACLVEEERGTFRRAGGLAGVAAEKPMTVAHRLAFARQNGRAHEERFARAQFAQIDEAHFDCRRGEAARRLLVTA